MASKYDQLDELIRRVGTSMAEDYLDHVEKEQRITAHIMERDALRRNRGNSEKHEG